MENGQNQTTKKRKGGEQITFKMEHEKIKRFRSDLSVHQFAKDIVCQVVEEDYKPNHHILDLLPEKVVRQYAIDKLKLITAKQGEPKTDVKKTTEVEEEKPPVVEQEQFVPQKEEEKSKPNWVLRIFLTVGVFVVGYFLWQRFGDKAKGLLNVGDTK